jgi:multicomponent Na+:H+ antiporter subunit E
MAVSGRTLTVLAAAIGLWLLLTDGDLASWLIGAPVVVAAAWSVASPPVAQGGAFSLSAALRFLPFFLWESLRGGVDVAARVLTRQPRVSPGFDTYRIRLKQGASRLLFANIVSLLPGTLAADLSGDSLRVHALDTGSNFLGELERLERLVGRIYGEVL